MFYTTATFPSNLLFLNIYHVKFLVNHTTRSQIQMYPQAIFCLL